MVRHHHQCDTRQNKGNRYGGQGRSPQKGEGGGAGARMRWRVMAQAMRLNNWGVAVKLDRPVSLLGSSIIVAGLIVGKSSVLWMWGRRQL